MYEELVMRLRCQLHGNCPACVNWYTEEVEPNLWRERCVAIDAADAIEELQRYIDGLNGVCSVNDALCKRIDELSKELDAMNEANIALHGALPKWIPVAERLPEKDGWYQVYAPSYSGGSSSGLKNINGNMYSAFKHGKWSIEVGYHKRPGCVKAWMPLPEPYEPPKEG